MKTYLKIHFHSEGDNPLKIIDLVRKAGFLPVVGDYDFVVEYGSLAEYKLIVDELHAALKGSGVYYRLVSRAESD